MPGVRRIETVPGSPPPFKIVVNVNATCTRMNDINTEHKMKTVPAGSVWLFAVICVIPFAVI